VTSAKAIGKGRKQHLLCYDEPVRDENSHQRRKRPNQEKRLDLLAFPELLRRLAALDERELHDVEHANELQHGKN